MTRWDLLNRGWRSGNSRKCWVEVGTHRPKKRVSPLWRRLRKRRLTVKLLNRGRRGGNLHFFREKWGRTARRCVSPLWRRLRKRHVTVGPLHRGWRGGNSRNFFEEVRTHRPKARVSAAGMAEKVTCYGGTFASWLKRCILPGFWLKFGRTAQRRVSPL